MSPVPVGMESGTLFDSQISASTVFNANCAARKARLHLKSGGKPWSWCALNNNYNQWLQVDLQQTTRVAGIATQGRHDANQWVTAYKLQFREGGYTFKFYRRNGDNSETVRLQVAKKKTCVKCLFEHGG